MREKSLDKSAMLSFLDETFRTGFFTHCFLEAGYLTDSTPEFRLIRAKDQRQTVYDLASLTKPLVTAPLSYRLLCEVSSAEPEQLRLADLRGSEDLQESIKQLTISSLLTHSSGLPAWLNFWIEHLNASSSFSELQDKAHQHILETMNRRRFELQGSEDCYSDVGFILLGFILERYYGLKLSDLFQEYLKTLPDLTYGENLGFPTLESWSKQLFITSAYCPVRQRWLRGEVHDENAAALGGLAGHAGLFASGPALSALIRQSFLSEQGSAFWAENERRRLHNLPLIGLRKGDDSASSQFANGEAMGHWGFTGTGFWVHVPTKRYTIILTNRVISSRRSTQTQAFRKVLLAYMNGLFDQATQS